MKTLSHITKIMLMITFAFVVLGCTKAPENATPASTQPSVVETTSDQSAQVRTRNIQDDIFYFVMPDRFHNGNPNNDNGDPERPISYGGLDVSSKWAFHGGDIPGLEAKLDYIQGLGVTAIWMTPILRNRAVQPDGFGHHGYWVVDFTEIDPHFGSNDDLKSLINAAHQRGIKIFFDIITNHTADVIKYEECHDAQGNFLDPQTKGCAFRSSDELANGNRYTPFVLPDEQNVKVPAWLNDPSLYNNQGDSFWQGESVIKGDFAGLDDLDTSNPIVVNGLTEVFKDLISEFKPDGFRIDTVKHVDLEFWQSFGPAITEHAQAIGIPEFFIFGEVYDGNPAGLSKYTNAGKLPSVLDFGFAFNVKDVVFESKSVNQLANLIDNDDYYRDADSTPNDLLNFLGNHDMGRVGQFIEQGLANISEEEKLKRSKLAHAFMYLSRGVPVLYYGDEQGFTSDNGDVDARENMDPSKVDSYNDNNLIGSTQTTADDNFNVNHPLYMYLSELADLRQTHTPLRNGDQINRFADEEKRVYAFSRMLPGSSQDYLVVFNFSTEPQNVELQNHGVAYAIEGDSQGALKQSEDSMDIELPPLSFALLRSQAPLPTSKILAASIQAPYEENDRIFIPLDLTFEEGNGFNMASVEFYAMQGDIESLVSFDTTYPYRAVLMKAQLEGVTSIKAEVTSQHGQVVTNNFQL
ncbi:alpha-amylase family glycosyl hydrolase [Glaciecola sp. XM2]|uniref:alpha-amylase family glycosyl hydrolase n=1 Tax=Glaciecola sp. XM2 TaxID=1914931 RepID=UPI002032D14D|nr:alpha-amylase family glycosyl hydrolase [Glaciecola sp. XM2]